MAYPQSLFQKGPWYATTSTPCIGGSTSMAQMQKNSVRSAGRMVSYSHAGDICHSMADRGSALDSAML